MHPNVKRGQKHHREHFAAITTTGTLAPGWEVWLLDAPIPGTQLRPDWVLVNRAEKRAFIIDLTTKFAPRHYEKGMRYRAEIQRILGDPAWEVVYVEDYWLNATIH